MKLETLILPEYIQSYIKQIEDNQYSEIDMEEVKKGIDEIPEGKRSKEITKRMWVQILKNDPHMWDPSNADLGNGKTLIKSEGPISLERFAENVAEIKCLCEKVDAVEFVSGSLVPQEYDLLLEQRYKDTINILLSCIIYW